jgi:nucleoside-diphosphate-sugar epimerase
MKICVTGGCGYKGSVLVPKLIEAGHFVTVLDTLWFGDALAPHHALRVYQCDIRTVESIGFHDAVIHLAGIANDPCGELDAKLTWEVNVLSTMRLADLALQAGVKQFIFASSASVYGLKDNKPVVETDSLAPVSDYNRTKMVAERVLLSYADKMAIQIVRPATVCGHSPRMRLDTMVNSLTMQALTKGEITAHCGETGGGLMRPNIHIEDVTDLYLFMLEHQELTGVYNAGFENISAMDTALAISEEIESRINITKVKDKRSYAVDSSKLLATGFKPRHTVRDAIRTLADKQRMGVLVQNESMMNLAWMVKNGWADGTRQGR